MDKTGFRRIGVQYMCEKIDALGRDSFVNNVKRVVDIISDSKKGCCFSINGKWGSGKSFVLELLEKELKIWQSEETCDNKYLVFHYDCWKYDYYDEPIISIVSAMLEETNKELQLFENVDTDIKNIWKTTKDILLEIAGNLCKNKIGIDLVKVINQDLIQNSIPEFDELYGFKKALEHTREQMGKIAKSKTMVIVVDELDRCLPNYSIKILERLHHIFDGVDNIIVILSIDKAQLSKSIKDIYGYEDADIDKYLRKFIAFEIGLDNGIPGAFLRKYATYASFFDIDESEAAQLEKLFKDLSVGMDMRSQERIFAKAEIIHKLIVTDDIRDSSIMAFEILFLTVTSRQKSLDLTWLLEYVLISGSKKVLGNEYYAMLREYADSAIDQRTTIDGKHPIQNNLIGKCFYWIAALYNNYSKGFCGLYYYAEEASKRCKMIKKFAELVQLIDADFLNDDQH